MSRALADILEPLVGKTKYHIKNSQHLVQKMSEVLIGDQEVFNSHDVVSLFTNTPIEKALDIIRKRMIEDKTQTNLEVEDVLKLLEFTLTTTYFSFRGHIYQQKIGAAMGSPVSPIVANLFMEFLEQEAIATCPVECAPKFWGRYVDDVLEIVKRGQIDNLTSHLNQADEMGSIKFTHEEEDDGKIPF